VKNQIINRKATIKVAKALGELNSEVVFVGGAMVSMYIDDAAAEDIRPTKDLDLTFQITTAGKLEQLRERLVQKGFTQTHEDNVICRFRFDDLLIDVMSTQAVGWAPSNRWFLPGFERAYPRQLDDVTIQLMPLPFFLASKMEAFFDRGINDLYASHDLEDIVYLFNYAQTLAEQIQQTGGAVADYLKACVARMMQNEIRSVIPGHLFYETADERFEIIMEKMKAITHEIQ
jgi:predicted nucleotidyltransferase